MTISVAGRRNLYSSPNDKENKQGININTMRAEYVLFL